MFALKKTQCLDLLLCHEKSINVSCGGGWGSLSAPWTAGQGFIKFPAT